MAPIVAQDHRNFTEATDAEVIHEIATDKTVGILAEACRHDEEARNDRDDIAPDQGHELREEEDIGEESSNFTNAQSFNEVANKPISLLYQNQTSNLFSDDRDTGFVIEEEDACVDWTTQPKNTVSPTGGFSNLSMGPSRSFDIPSINTAYYDGNNDLESPRFSIPSQSAFLKNVRNASISFASVLSPTSSMGLEDIDLKASSSSVTGGENLTTINTIDISDGKEETVTHERNILTANSPSKKAETKPSNSVPGSIFGMEPFPWEIKGNRMQKPKSSSSNSTTSKSSFASSVVGSNNFSIISSKADFSSIKLVDSFKKWRKEINAVVNEFFNEDESKDAFVAHFGRQVSRVAAENMYNQYRSII